MQRVLAKRPKGALRGNWPRGRRGSIVPIGLRRLIASSLRSSPANWQAREKSEIEPDCFVANGKSRIGATRATPNGSMADIV